MEASGVNPHQRKCHLMDKFWGDLCPPPSPGRHPGPENRDNYVPYLIIHEAAEVFERDRRRPGPGSF